VAWVRTGVRQRQVRGEVGPDRLWFGSSGPWQRERCPGLGQGKGVRVWAGGLSKRELGQGIGQWDPGTLGLAAGNAGASGSGTDAGARSLGPGRKGLVNVDERGVSVWQYGRVVSMRA
jgi:hypothetical protein